MNPNMDPAQAQEMAMKMMAGMIPIICIAYIVKIALYVVPLWQIYKKAGLSPALSLLAAIPVVGRLVALYVVGFSDWTTLPTPQPYTMPPVYPPPSSYPPQPPTL